MNRIITIGREFGSGGREFARRLAEELNCEYYDREIISEIAKHTQLSEEYVRDVVEHRVHNLFPITVGETFTIANLDNLNQVQSVFNAQAEIMKSLANKSDCVIVGRCADFILEDMNPFKIFIYADIESRVKRCKERNKDVSLTDKEIKKQILKIDKDRSKYYYFYTGLKWGEKDHYNLCINTSNVDIKAAVKMTAKLFKDDK